MAGRFFIGLCHGTLLGVLALAALSLAVPVVVPDSAVAEAEAGAAVVPAAEPAPESAVVVNAEPADNAAAAPVVDVTDDSAALPDVAPTPNDDAPVTAVATTDSAVQPDPTPTPTPPTDTDPQPPVPVAVDDVTLPVGSEFGRGGDFAPITPDASETALDRDTAAPLPQVAGAGAPPDILADPVAPPAILSGPSRVDPALVGDGDVVAAPSVGDVARPHTPALPAALPSRDAAPNQTAERSTRPAGASQAAPDLRLPALNLGRD
ncbi:hypothetical protein [Paracoccus sp. (in: a-proteobacteria)]|uniref:hypothetical protein n=1 Tax=Paracoccus sp. TaxID=267 RepID=UPI0026DFEFDD|nr:hypothetical protein [Paracoccus sp. (in: a-proteobacteria)]MDO5646526.1 hypothetical protein [Paracoccus sp. (in: a-proteobacteria)]